MSDYTNTFGGAAKDSGNDTILGAQHDTEYDAVATMSGTKANKIVSATTGGLVKQTSTGDLADAADTGTATVDALTVNGAFTSVGIDDNATGERLQISDTVADFGAAGAAYTIAHSVNDQNLNISGGNSSSQGANILMYGGTHATTGDMVFRNDSTSWMVWDESGGDLTFYTGTGAKTQALELNQSQAATFAGAVVVQGLFTSLGIDDNATEEALQIGDSTLVIGTATGAANFSTYRKVNDAQTIISGGNNTNVGSNILLYGGAHANTGDFILRNDTNEFLKWDETAGSFVINTGVGAKTLALTLDSSLDATFAGGITAGSDIVSDTDSTDDLGSTGVRWATLYVDDIVVTNQQQLVQTVFNQDSTVATTTTTMPYDDTIPQITEGGQFFSQAITVGSASNKLKIEVVANCSHNGAGAPVLQMALFNTDHHATNAISTVTTRTETVANVPQQLVMTHYMTAPTSGATTFTVRIGSDDAGTVTFNGAAGAQIGGGVMGSTITITEYTP